MSPLQHSFFNALMKCENSIKAGFRDGRWYPHKSVEGGNDTIAYGHKLTNVERESKKFQYGLSELDAVELLHDDFNTAMTVARNNWNDFYIPKFDQLPERYQYVLGELVFNSGPLIKSDKFRWPKLAQAIKDNDDQQVYEQSIRWYTDPKGVKTALRSRSQAICKSLGIFFV